MILTRLEGVKTRFEEVGQLITDPSVISDMNRYVKLNREYKQLEPVVAALNSYKDLLSNIESAREMLAEEKDEEMKEMAREELELFQQQLGPLEEDIKLLLLPKDPEDEKSAIVEIRAGTGAMRPAFLQVTCTGCTANCLNQKDGRHRPPVSRRGLSEDIRRSS